MKSSSRLPYGSKPPSAVLSCGLLESCYPAGLSLGRADDCSALACTRSFVPRGGSLYGLGDPFRSIYTIIAGTFKVCTMTERGEEQVMGFHMRGAIMGLDAIATGRYTGSAVAIEDSQVCVVSAECLEEHCLHDQSVAKRIHAALGREIVARQRMILTLGRKTAEERVATFLMELAATYVALGYSSSEMHMVMTRLEIGSYLGLSLETVSRIFSEFQDRTLIEVDLKHIRLLDFAGLKRLAGSPAR